MKIQHKVNQSQSTEQRPNVCPDKPSKQDTLFYKQQCPIIFINKKLWNKNQSISQNTTEYGNGYQHGYGYRYCLDYFILKHPNSTSTQYLA